MHPTALAQRAGFANQPGSERTAIVVQEVNHIRVRPPPGCPPAAIIVNQNASISAVGDPVQALLDLSRDVVVDTVAAAAQAELQRLFPASPPVVGPVPRAAIAAALDERTATLVQQDVQTNQTVRYVTAQTCGGLMITNDAALEVATVSLAEAAADALLRSLGITPDDAASPTTTTTTTRPPKAPRRDDRDLPMAVAVGALVFFVIIALWRILR